MAETKTTTIAKRVLLDIETLNQVALRLEERASTIHQFSLMELVLDLRTAARCANILAHLRFELGEIAGKTKDPDTARELRDLLDDAFVAEPAVGQP